jgi:guanylate kinase
MLFVLSAPSGTGKTTIARRILPQFSDLRFSVSATTRAIRHREVDGRDYHFLTREKFRHEIETGGLIEWEEIFGNLYGSLRSEVDSSLKSGEHLLFDIDVNGALRIKEQYDGEAVLIFIRPPSIDVLRKRLEKRGTDTPQIIEKRLERAELELAMSTRFDFSVTNDDLDRAVQAVAEIISQQIKVKVKY